MDVPNKKSFENCIVNPPLALLFDLLKCGVQLFDLLWLDCIDCLLEKTLEGHTCHHLMEILITAGGLRYIAAAGAGPVHDPAHNIRRMGDSPSARQRYPR